MCIMRVLRSGTGDSMNGKQQQTACEQQDWKQQPGCQDFDPALDTMWLSWRTTPLAPGHPHHAPLSPPGNHVWLQHTHTYAQRKHQTNLQGTDCKAQNRFSFGNQLSLFLISCFARTFESLRQHLTNIKNRTCPCVILFIISLLGCYHI